MVPKLVYLLNQTEQYFGLRYKVGVMLSKQEKQQLVAQQSAPERPPQNNLLFSKFLSDIQVCLTIFFFETISAGHGQLVTR